ncbi:MAG: hypothetical protein EZS28_005684 [Streblomastix strix]|uniref:Uncharacterized protein n=1 Tax=Streblomastix strix TaxID=222440 RepID=A0A5J4WWA5_9EUKA|nr:MAG: hypothetical protein EZS28_005684 [Streblomastix strix]
MPIHVEQQEFSAMCLFKDMYDKSSAVQVAVSGQLNIFDCEYQGMYVIDNYNNESASNEASNEDVDSPYNIFYIVDDSTCRVRVFNLYFESKGIFSKIKQLAQNVGKDLQCANDNVYKPFVKPFVKPILGAQGPVGQTIGKGIHVASSFLDYGYGADKNGQFGQDFETLRNDEYLKQKLPIGIQSRRIQLQNI